MAELTYPSHEAVSTALMLFACRVFATGFGFLGTVLAEKDFYLCAGFIGGVSVLGALPAFFVDEELRKVGVKRFYDFFNQSRAGRTLKP